MSQSKRNLFVVSQLALLISAIATQGAYAQVSAKASTKSKASAPAEELLVIGSYRKDLTSLQASAPVDVISAEKLQATGAVTLNEALEKLHPSFNFPQGQNSWNGQNTRSASLRNVSPAYTLVLVNGKRRHTSSQITNTLPYPASVAVDINTIPVSAVARVDVLRDGAAAQYGSDAIAGVINVVLREDSEGGNVNARVGGHSDGGGYTRTINGWKGIDLNGKGFLNFSADYFTSDFVNRADPDWRPQFPDGDARNQTIGNSWAKWGNGARESWSALVNGEYELESARLYGYLNYSDRVSGSYVNPERVINSATDFSTGITRITGANTRNSPIHPDGYQPYAESDSQDLASVFGSEFGSVEAAGKLDLSVSYGQNESGKWTLDTANPSWGDKSPTDFYWGSTKFEQTSLQADYVKEFNVGFLSSPLTFSAGLLNRHEKWQTVDFADEAGYTNGGLSTADNKLPIMASSVDSPIQPQDAGSVDRDVWGGYVGAEGDLTDRLQIGLAARYEDYSDFGGTTNGKVTARYEITDEVALRGTYSNGFHAPNLAQLGTQTTGYTATWTNTGLVVATPGQTLLFRPDDERAKIFGAKPLEPEESTSISAGLVITLADNTSITIDGYHLTIEDSIIPIDRISGAAVTNAFVDIGLPGYTQAQYYYNGWDTTTKGVDIAFKTSFDNILGGDLAVSLGASFSDTQVENAKSKLIVGTTEFTVIDPYRIRDAERGTPDNKFTLDLTYTNGAWKTTAFLKHYGPYWYNASATGLQPGGNGNRDQEFNEEWYLDLNVDYEVNDNWNVFVGAKNIGNAYPDKYVIGNRSNGVNTYGFVHPNGSSGRFVYGGINYNF